MMFGSLHLRTLVESVLTRRFDHGGGAENEGQRAPAGSRNRPHSSPAGDIGVRRHDDLWVGAGRDIQTSDDRRQSAIEMLPAGPCREGPSRGRKAPPSAAVWPACRASACGSCVPPLPFRASVQPGFRVGVSGGVVAGTCSGSGTYVPFPSSQRKVDPSMTRSR